MDVRERHQRRDEQLARRIHDDHAWAVRATVARRTGDPQLADDIVQECLVRALDEPTLAAADPDRVRAWMLVVARNLAIDHHRSARARREVPTESATHARRAADRDATAAALDRWLVADALSDLTREHREVIVRSYYGGLTISELAAVLEVPAGTVKSRLHYGLRALRVALQERGVHPG